MTKGITNGQDVAAAQQKLTQAQTRKTTAVAQQSSAQSLFSSTPQYIKQAKEQTTTDVNGNTNTIKVMEEILNPDWQEALNALNEANYELSSAEEEVSGAEEEVSEAEEAEEEAKEAEEVEEAETTDSTADETSGSTTTSTLTPDDFASFYQRIKNRSCGENITLDEAKAELKSKHGDVDPDAYAQKYANDNNMTLDEAKAELKSKYGDPTSTTDSSTDTATDSTTDSTTDATSDTIPEGVDPDTYAQEYADANKITVDEAKEILKSKYNDPEYDENRNNDSTEELTKQEQELQDKGIPVDVIKQGGDAIRKYAKDHDIELNNPEE